MKKYEITTCDNNGSLCYTFRERKTGKNIYTSNVLSHVMAYANGYASSSMQKLDDICIIRIKQ